MISLTRLNHSHVLVNAMAIAYVERTPDTLVTLLNGERFHVRESVEQLVSEVTAFHRAIHHVDGASIAVAPATAA
jgi:flagellar protein FlbD